MVRNMGKYRGSDREVRRIVCNVGDIERGSGMGMVGSEMGNRK